MGKVTQVSNGATGNTARLAWNEAVKSGDVETSDFANGTDGELITWDATGSPATVGVGTVNHVLTSNGAGNPPTMQDPATNALIAALLAGVPTTKSYSIGKVPSGTHYLAGWYNASATDANLTQASTTVTIGTANVAYAAHAFCVAGAAGVTDGSDLVLTVSGTSITDAGVRTGGDSQVIVADCTAAATDQFFETPKKWIGQITFTLSSTGGTAFNFDFNYGLNKYEDFGNRSFQVEDFEVVGEANTTDTGFEIELLKQDDQNWTYSAAAFVPGGTVLLSMNTDHGAEQNLQAGQEFAYKRANVAVLVDGDDSEGVIIRLTQGANNSIEHADFHIGVLITESIIT